MGVEHYLVDEEGGNVLDCHKWYEIAPADWGNVTDAEIEAAGEKYDWLPAIAIRWRREVCGGRQLQLTTDMSDCLWHDDEWKRLPGWTLYTPWYPDTLPQKGWVRYPVAEKLTPRE